MVKVVQIGANILRKKAQRVPISDIRSGNVKNVLADMKTALHGSDNGVAIAAPQIGFSYRIFIVSGEIFKKNEEDETPEDRVYINPKIVKKSRKKETLDEGCLSVVGKYGTIKRSAKATVIALDENGKKFEQGGSGFLAQIFQHETDHLDGTLFVDKAEEVHDIEDEE